ncbi:hypothetical protein [Streptomyces sp. NPDC002855]|uniref:hypothetical protein n=1 Tax=Streptomyces sp. NPDC002855 TaxID=3154437 RepID=UPI003329F2E1
MPNWTPRLTNVKGSDMSTATGVYARSGDVVAFTATVNPGVGVESADSTGFGLTLPVPAKAGARYVFELSVDGRDVDHGIWAGQAQVYAGSDGAAIDRLRLPGGVNGDALKNITGFYGPGEAGAAGEILTVTGVYVAA